MVYSGVRFPAMLLTAQTTGTNSIKITNAEKLIEGLVLVGTNVNHEPLVMLKENPSLGEFIIRQSGLRLSIGVPTIETQLFDAKSGKKVYTARDEDGFGMAESVFSRLEFDCNNKAINDAKKKTSAVVDVLGFLGC